MIPNKFRHDIKSITCNPITGGCGLLYTLQPEYNSLHDKMRVYRIIQHAYKPQILDKKTKDLRDMTPGEHAQHIDAIKGLVIQQLKQDQKKLPFNTLVIKDKVVNTVLVHTLEMESVYAKVESELKQLISGEGGYGIVKMVSQILIKCPKCDRVGAIVERVQEPRILSNTKET